MTRSTLATTVGYGILAAALLACLYLISLAPLRLDWGRELVGGTIAVVAMLAGLSAARRWTSASGRDSGDKAAEPGEPPGSAPVVPTADSEVATLSTRESEVLQLLCSGQSNKQIARSLQLSENTIKTHLAHVYEKLGVNKRTEAMAVAQRLGLVSIRDW